MKYWLILWKTWFEGEIDIPWPIAIYENTTDYKSKQGYKSVSKNAVNTVYQSFDENKVEKFEDENIDAVILAGIIKSNFIETAIKEIQTTFNDAEIQNYQQLTDIEAQELTEIFSRK